MVIAMGLVIQVIQVNGAIVGRVSANHHPLGSSSTPLGGIILIYAPHCLPYSKANLIRLKGSSLTCVYTTWKWHRKIKKKKISLAVKIGSAVKKNYDDLVVKKESDFPRKKNMGWRLRPENIRFGFSYGIPHAVGAHVSVHAVISSQL